MASLVDRDGEAIDSRHEDELARDRWLHHRGRGGDRAISRLRSGRLPDRIARTQAEFDCALAYGLQVHVSRIRSLLRSSAGSLHFCFAFIRGHFGFGLFRRVGDAFGNAGAAADVNQRHGGNGQQQQKSFDQHDISPWLGCTLDQEEAGVRIVGSKTF